MKKLIGAAIAAILMASSAHAVTANYDFQAIADGGLFSTTNSTTPNGSEGSWASVVGGATVGIIDNGISVVGTGLGDDGSGNITNLNGYFDSGNAGLGVCQTLTGTAQCNPANDDNVGPIGGSNGNANGGTSFETLVLTFSTLVGIDALNLAGEGHGNFGGEVIINGQLFTQTHFTGIGS